MAPSTFTVPAMLVFAFAALKPTNCTAGLRRSWDGRAPRRAASGRLRRRRAALCRRSRSPLFPDQGPPARRFLSIRHLSKAAPRAQQPANHAVPQGFAGARTLVQGQIANPDVQSLVGVRGPAQPDGQRALARARSRVEEARPGRHGRGAADEPDRLRRLRRLVRVGGDLGAARRARRRRRSSAAPSTCSRTSSSRCPRSTARRTSCATTTSRAGGGSGTGARSSAAPGTCS